jgi:hypothetical protein
MFALNRVMVHKDNLERVNRENSRIAAVEERCQEAIHEILDEENLEARIVFYPAHPKSQI